MNATSCSRGGDLRGESLRRGEIRSLKVEGLFWGRRSCRCSVPQRVCHRQEDPQAHAAALPLLHCAAPLAWRTFAAAAACTVGAFVSENHELMLRPTRKAWASLVRPLFCLSGFLRLAFRLGACRRVSVVIPFSWAEACDFASAFCHCARSFWRKVSSKEQCRGGIHGCGLRGFGRESGRARAGFVPLSLIWRV